MALVNNYNDHLDVLPGDEPAPAPLPSLSSGAFMGYNPYAPGSGSSFDYRPAREPVTKNWEDERHAPKADVAAYYAKMGMLGQGNIVAMGDDDNPMYAAVSNPGTIDLLQANPSMYAELMRRRGYRDQFDQRNADFLNPARNAARRANALQEASTRSMNAAGRMGLGGSSLALGAAHEAARQTNFGWDDRQMQQELQMLQMEQAMTGGIERDIAGIQSQYERYQDRTNNLLLGVENANAEADAADANMWASIIGAVGRLGGAAIGGPGGAAVGGTAGDAAGGALRSSGASLRNAMPEPIDFSGPNPWASDDY